MAKIHQIHFLELNPQEVVALKKLLGSLTDRQFKTYGIEGENREHIRNIFNELPYPDEEED